MWMCDTSVVAEVLSPSPNPALWAWLQSQKRIAMSTITVEEILFELESRGQPQLGQWFERFLANHCQVLEVTQSVSRRSGLLRARAKKLGGQAGQGDFLIAATALEHALPLATKNGTVFQRCGVAVMNPFEELMR